MFSISSSSTLVSSGILLNTASPSTVADGSTSHLPTRFIFHKYSVPRNETTNPVDAKDLLEKLSDDVHTQLIKHIKSKL